MQLSNWRVEKAARLHCSWLRRTAISSACARSSKPARTSSRAAENGWTASLSAICRGRFECARALLEAGANATQLRNDGTRALEYACRPRGALQLLCAYAPSREAVRAHPKPADRLSPECAQWLAATRRWTSPLHQLQLELLTLELRRLQGRWS